MVKYIVHASINENGKVSGGTQGDQTGKEVCIRTWYSKPWTYVLRLKDEKVRKQFANNMIDCANNSKIGYDQGQRNTLLTQAIKVNFDLSKIKVKCSCDCSSLVTICILGAIYKVQGKEKYEEAYKVLYAGNNCKTTSSLRKALNSLKLITLYSTFAYTGSTSKLVFGDILLKEGSHVVAYIDNGYKVCTDEMLKVDGKWGPATTRRAQEVFGTKVDGIVSGQYSKYKKSNPGLLSSTFDWKLIPMKRSSLIKAIQKEVGIKQDGRIGPDTIKAMQRWLGTPVDGKVSNPSLMVKAFQKWLNKQ